MSVSLPPVGEVTTTLSLRGVGPSPVGSAVSVIIAGVTVALVLIPQSMAYAQLAGLPPYYGLYAAFLPPIVAAVFGSSRQLATGPVAVVSLLTAAALEPIATAGSGAYIAYAIMLALMVGIFQLSLGLLRLGVLINFLSHPVVIGFTNAAAIIIATSQLDKIFGVAVDKAEHHYETVWNILVAAGTQTHWPTLGVAVLAFAIIILMRKYTPKLPGVIFAVLATTLISWQFGFEHKMSAEQAQFASRTVRSQVADQVKWLDELSQLNDKIVEARAKYSEAVKEHGKDDDRARTAQDALDAATRARARRTKVTQAEWKEMKSMRFEYVPGKSDRPGRFYRQGNVPARATTDGIFWRLDEIGRSGSIAVRAGGKVVGAVPEGLPAMHFPKFDVTVVMQLLAAAVAIAFIGFMEAISIAKAMASGS